MATKGRKARNQGQNQDQPVDSEIRRAAERIGYKPGPGAEMNGDEYAAFQALLTCGLYVREGDGDCCVYEEAIRHFAVSTLKAVAIAAANEGKTGDDHADPWPTDVAFSMHDAARVIAGVANLIEHSPAVLAYARLDQETEAGVTP